MEFGPDLDSGHHHGYQPSTPMYRGDLMGKPLDSGAVRVARDLDIEYFKKMGVYEKAPGVEAKANGSRSLGVRWFNVRNADGLHRSRVVAKEFKTYNAPELGDPTHRHMTVRNVEGGAGQDDVHHAHRHDQGMLLCQGKPEFVRQAASGGPEKLGEEHLCGKLNKAMCGTRDAAQNWQRVCAPKLRAN